MPDRREFLDDDHRGLARRLHERGLWMVEVRRTDTGYAVLTTSGRIEVPPREESAPVGPWADAAADRVLAHLVEAM